MHSVDPSSPVNEAGGLRVQVQPGLQNKTMDQQSVHKTATVTESVPWEKSSVYCITLAQGARKLPFPLLTSGFLHVNNGRYGWKDGSVSTQHVDLSLVPRPHESKSWALWHIHTCNASAEEAEPKGCLGLTGRLDMLS